MGCSWFRVFDSNKAETSQRKNGDIIFRSFGLQRLVPAPGVARSTYLYLVLEAECWPIALRPSSSRSPLLASLHCCVSWLAALPLIRIFCKFCWPFFNSPAPTISSGSISSYLDVPFFAASRRGAAFRLGIAHHSRPPGVCLR